MLSAYLRERRVWAVERRTDSAVERCDICVVRSRRRVVVSVSMVSRSGSVRWVGSALGDRGEGGGGLERGGGAVER